MVNFIRLSTADSIGFTHTWRLTLTHATNILFNQLPPMLTLQQFSKRLL